MAIDSMQKRMSAIAPASPWRGPMVDATESSFNAGNRAAAAFMYSGVVDAGAPAITGTAAVTLPAITVAASGTQLLAITGSSAITLPSITVAASGTQLLAITGDSEIILPSVTVDATGTAGSEELVGRPIRRRKGYTGWRRWLDQAHKPQAKPAEDWRALLDAAQIELRAAQSDRMIAEIALMERVVSKVMAGIEAKEQADRDDEDDIAVILTAIH